MSRSAARRRCLRSSRTDWLTRKPLRPAQGGWWACWIRDSPSRRKRQGQSAWQGQGRCGYLLRNAHCGRLQWRSARNHDPRHHGVQPASQGLPQQGMGKAHRCARRGQQAHAFFWLQHGLGRQGLAPLPKNSLKTCRTSLAKPLRSSTSAICGRPRFRLWRRSQNSSINIITKILQYLYNAHIAFGPPLAQPAQSFEQGAADFAAATGQECAVRPVPCR